MKTTTTFSIGSLALLNKVDAEYDYFNALFKNVSAISKNTLKSVKFLINNRLSHCVAINRFNEIYPEELFEKFEFKKKPSNRSINRELERIGRIYPLLLANHQEFLKEENLLSDKNFIDFSSSYFEGKAEAFGEFGYSRDGQPGKKQLTFGVATGINGIPSALTIQKGNVQDKKHFSIMLRTAEAVLPEKSLVIFDCGGNTKENKKQILTKNLHYLTLKQKKKSVYQKFISIFNTEKEKSKIEINGVTYECVKKKESDETNYIFFNQKMKETQLAMKQRKFAKTLEKNKPLLDRTKKGKPLTEYPCEEGTIIAKGELQKSLEDKMPNNLINGLEGYFILESSVDTDPQFILSLYKDKDKVEKFIQSMKEGTELRPMRHWSHWALCGHILITFLTNFLINLTLLRTPNSLVKNVKLLKKYLTNLTLTVVYPPTGFKFSILANICPEIRSFFGDFINRYHDQTLPLRW